MHGGNSNPPAQAIPPFANDPLDCHLSRVPEERAVEHAVQTLIREDAGQECPDGATHAVSCDDIQ